MLVHVDTEQAHDQLINSRLAYVSVSRGRFDAHIYTNDAGRMGEELSRDISKQAALDSQNEMGRQDRDHPNDSVGHQSVNESESHGGYSIGH